MKTCPGARTKAAAAQTIERCQRGQASTNSQGRHRISVLHLGSLTAVTCSCGSASIWDYKPPLTVNSSFSRYSTEGTDDVITHILKKNCVMQLMPSTKNSVMLRWTEEELDRLIDLSMLVHQVSLELYYHWEAETLEDRSEG